MSRFSLENSFKFYSVSDDFAFVSYSRVAGHQNNFELILPLLNYFRSAYASRSKLAGGVKSPI